MALKLTAPRVLAASSFFLTGFIAYRYRSAHRLNNESSPSNTMTVNHSFQTQFAVPLSCDGCVKSVSDSVLKLGGISKVEGNLKDQLIYVEGSAAPSAIVEAIQATGRDAILRGSGTSDSAAVSILETYTDKKQTAHEGTNREVRGLARMVQVSSGRTLVDLTVRGVSPGTYSASIREYGDLKDGAESTGPVWKGPSGEAKGDLGKLEVGTDGRGAAFVDYPFQIWEAIGHAMVLTKQEDGQSLKNDIDTVVGVVARSAGVWDNDKTVCSCTGKTLWEERKDEVAKGML
ncbi:unnamed protein product [Clonostachys rosea]|uniref:Superoxide dismutase 1 copper chaperone n=1 Tax=Bionectria ochroleuca TaxID=29856 RepID=A0ABY6UW16_BIOOC|nr:unnamed protein product [Clonostachys rosea]